MSIAQVYREFASFKKQRVVTKVKFANEQYKKSRIDSSLNVLATHTHKQSIGPNFYCQIIVILALNLVKKLGFCLRFKKDAGVIAALKP